MKNKQFIDLLPIETERVYLRPSGVEDVDLMLKMDKQEETQEFLGGIKDRSREERMELLEKKHKKFDEEIASQLTVCLKDGTPIGFTGLKIDEKNNSAELSYLFDVDYTKKGYCSESTRKLLDIAFNILDLHRVYGDTVEGNINSKKVFERFGFKLEGTRRDAAYDDKKGVYRNFLDYGLLKDEYK